MMLIVDLFSGRGGASIFGKQFEDEINVELKFTGKFIQTYMLLSYSSTLGIISSKYTEMFQPNI